MTSAPETAIVEPMPASSASEETTSLPKLSKRRRAAKRATPTRPPAASEAESAIAVRRSSIQGRGVFAVRDIAKGELIVEYLGKRMTHEAASAQCDDESVRRHHTFLFSIDDELCIDGGKEGNEARLINHSCAPNAFAEIENRRIFIRALRRIAAGEEIAYDYWYSTDPSYTLDDLKRLYPCRCGAPKCRGTIAAPPKKKRRAKASARKTARARNSR
jgi:SET domain-containing protein